ncbi:DUF563 domain-containing protein [Nocardioides sp. SYSU D00038]|uniref:glycosyltransferase family 61 protein n=1 Tax=Nocardioides sp. SYSU D00038 TaxID=2812554 RepID=UPI00196745C7|nr:glycosyltransferase family 61 protein [Nocardioides sp. SYSU D00038]
MSRLPARLQPAWPLLKRVHRALSLLLGLLYRRTAPLTPRRRRLPVRATATSADTAAREPGAVTLHPGGPAERLRREPPEGDPPGHWRFAHELTFDVPARYVLEVRGGSVVGEHAAVVTPGGTLDFQTSNYFGIAGWREHPVFLHPRLPREQHVDGTLLNLTTRGSTANYYHVLLDVLPRYGVFREALPDATVDAVAVPHGTGYQRQLLAMVGLGDGTTLVQPAADLTLTADRLLVPSTPNDALSAPRWVVRWLREHLPASGVPTGRPRLYVTRGDRPHTRRYVEEEQLWPELESRGFLRLDPGQHSVQEQVDLFSGAEVVVAPHGAALANLVFLPPKARVLELFAPTYVNHCYWTITQALDDVEHHYLVGAGRVPREGAEMTGVLTDVRLDPTKVLAYVDRLL